MEAAPARISLLAPSWGTIIITTAAASVVVLGVWRVVKTRSARTSDGL